METTPIPINQPKVITSMMGSVFGSPMKGVELVPQSNPTTPVNPVVKPALDVLTEKVATLEASYKEMQALLEKIKQDVDGVAKTILATATIVSSDDMGLAPEKKKPGRPKKT